MAQLILAISLWEVMFSILKYSVTQWTSLAVYGKETLPFAQDVSLENSENPYVCYWPALLHLVSYFFFLNQSPSFSMLFYFT